MRQQITVGASSYIKIADGCNYKCGYCVIPQLRGPYSSRPIEKIVEEAKMLAQKGVSEIVLIAQDTTGYGIDLYKKPSLAKLLKDCDELHKVTIIPRGYALGITWTKPEDNKVHVSKSKLFLPTPLSSTIA